MHRIITILVLGSVLLPFIATAAIASDVITNSSTLTASPFSYSSTLTGSSDVVCVGARVNAGTNTITSVTGNGVTLTRYETWDDSLGYYAGGIYCGTATTSGSYVTTITSSGATVAGVTESWTGAGSVGAHTTHAITTGSPNTATITTTADNAWIFGYGGDDGGNPAAGTNTTLDANNSGAMAAFSSGGARTPAGSQNLQFTCTACTNSVLAIIEIQPTVVASTAFYSTSPWWFLFQ